MWDEVVHSILNVNGATVGLWEKIRYFIPYNIIDVVTNQKYYKFPFCLRSTSQNNAHWSRALVMCCAHLRATLHSLLQRDKCAGWVEIDMQDVVSAFGLSKLWQMAGLAAILMVEKQVYPLVYLSTMKKPGDLICLFHTFITLPLSGTAI